MHKITLITFIIFLLYGCSTTTIYSARSEGDIEELYATCAGPIGASYINRKGKPFLLVGAKKTEGKTRIFMSKHGNYKNDIVEFPSELKLFVDDTELIIPKVRIKETGNKKHNSTHYESTIFLKNFTADIGSVDLNGENIKIEPINFTYEERRFLMCLQ
jgi:hypothetical protein